MSVKNDPTQKNLQSGMKITNCCGKTIKAKINFKLRNKKEQPKTSETELEAIASKTQIEFLQNGTTTSCEQYEEEY